jgi:hypothetical protein
MTENIGFEDEKVLNIYCPFGEKNCRTNCVLYDREQECCLIVAAIDYFGDLKIWLEALVKIIERR